MKGRSRKPIFDWPPRRCPLQFPEHTKESHEAGARMGAGILECDVTFTRDGELVPPRSVRPAHDDEYPADSRSGGEMHPTILAGGVRCPRAPHEGRIGALLHQRPDRGRVQRLKGKMDASNPNARGTRIPGGTANWRTDLYSTGGTLLTHKESIELIKALDGKYARSSKGPTVRRRYRSNRCSAPRRIRAGDDQRLQGGAGPTLESLGAVVQQSRRADVDPDRSAVRSPGRVLWTMRMFRPMFRAQPICSAMPKRASASLRRRCGCCCPPATAGLCRRNTQRTPRPPASTSSPGRSNARANRGRGAADPGHHESVVLLPDDPRRPAQRRRHHAATLDVLARDVGILGIFSDWSGTVSYYASCMGLK